MFGVLEAVLSPRLGNFVVFSPGSRATLAEPLFLTSTSSPIHHINFQISLKDRPFCRSLFSLTIQISTRSHALTPTRRSKMAPTISEKHDDLDNPPQHDQPCGCYGLLLWWEFPVWYAYVVAFIASMPYQHNFSDVLGSRVSNQSTGGSN